MELRPVGELNTVDGLDILALSIQLGISGILLLTVELVQQETGEQTTHRLLDAGIRTTLAKQELLQTVLAEGLLVAVLHGAVRGRTSPVESQTRRVARIKNRVRVLIRTDD